MGVCIWVPVFCSAIPTGNIPYLICCMVTARIPAVCGHTQPPIPNLVCISQLCANPDIGIPIHVYKGIPIHLYKGIPIHLYKGIPIHVYKGIPIHLSCHSRCTSHITVVAPVISQSLHQSYHSRCTSHITVAVPVISQSLHQPYRSRCTSHITVYYLVHTVHTLHSKHTVHTEYTYVQLSMLWKLCICEWFQLSNWLLVGEVVWK